MKKWIASILFALVLCVHTSFAEAIILGITPSSATVSVGDSVRLDVTISGLGNGVAPSVGAFDLNLRYNAAVLSPVSVDFGPFLGDPLLVEALTDFSFSVPGIMNFAEVSLLPDADLNALQPSSFRLATLFLVGIGSGTSPFAFVGDIRVDDSFGNKLQIPEPAPIFLIGLAIAALWNSTRVQGRGH